VSVIRKQNRPGITPAFSFLLLLFLANSLLVNKILDHWRPTTVLDYSNRFASVPVHGYRDSWEPMWRAVNYLEESSDRLLYQELFFTEKIKFQYAPTSLLLIEPLKKLPLNYLTYVLNFTSWFLVWLVAFYACRIFLFHIRGADRYDACSNLERLLFFVSWLYLAITFYPIVRSWRLGQVQTLNTFLFAVALWKYARGRMTLSGVLMGFVCAFKPHYCILLVWALWRKQRKFVIGLAGTLGCLIIASVSLYGVANHVDYMSVLAYIGKHGESFYANQSMNGLLNRAFFNGNNLVWDAHDFPPYNRWVFIGTVITAGILIITALFVKERGAPKNQSVFTIEFMIAVLSITMASPIAWEHHYGFMLPMFACVIPRVLRSRMNTGILISVVAAYVLSSNYYQVTDAVADSALNVLQSYLYAGALLFLLCMYIIRRELIRGLSSE
jgi:hypothetical protein